MLPNGRPTVRALWLQEEKRIWAKTRETLKAMTRQEILFNTISPESGEWRSKRALSRFGPDLLGIPLAFGVSDDFWSWRRLGFHDKFCTKTTLVLVFFSSFLYYRLPSILFTSSTEFSVRAPAHLTPPNPDC